MAPPRPSVDSVDSNMCRCVDTGAMMPHPSTNTTNIDWPLLWAVQRGVRGHTHSSLTPVLELELARVRAS